MSPIKILFLTLLLNVLNTSESHKFYVSVSEVEYVKEKNSVQIITRLFVDDLERVLRNRYNNQLTLSAKNEAPNVKGFLELYLKDKLQIKINGQESQFEFIGKEHETDIVYCYLEIKNIKEIKSFEITNKLLFDGFEDQQNIVKTSINSQSKSFILTIHNDKGMLKF